MQVRMIEQYQPELLCKRAAATYGIIRKTANDNLEIIRLPGEGLLWQVEKY